ncbi:MAG: hypothetical protein AB7U82_27805 [Blastocatellales bacterium]
MFLQKLAISLAITGEGLTSLDADNVGADDTAGALLVYGAEVLAAVSNDENLPPSPVLQVVTDNLSGKALTTIKLARVGLTAASVFLSFQDRRAATAIKYVRQALDALANGQAFPTAPAI